jgi:chemotaxis protein methyltransferase CheR
MNSSILASPHRPELSVRDFDRIRKLAFDYCGLDIERGKEELVASRLGKIMRGLDISSYGRYYDHVVADHTSKALVTMIDSLTTNHTSFFREPQHFAFLKSTVFPALANRSHIDIWSAASSSGEEPYSVAFAARDFYGEAGPELRILASDISTRILETAKNATYDVQRLTGIPMDLLQRYFLRGKGPASSLYRVKPSIRNNVRFERLNLMESFSGLSLHFPLILCRNVMIYFNATTQQELIERFYQQMEPGGYLFIGHSESLNRIAHNFEYIAPAIYRKPGVLKGEIDSRGRAA